MGIPVEAKLPVGEIPPNARQHGGVPDVSALMSGDLILMQPANPDWVSRSIRHAQRGFSSEDAQWTHAAVLVIDDLIVEAGPGRGVRTRSLYERVPTDKFLVRRYPNISGE